MGEKLEPFRTDIDHLLPKKTYRFKLLFFFFSPNYKVEHARGLHIEHYGLR